MKKSLLTLTLICLGAGAGWGITITPEDALSRVLGMNHPATRKASVEKPQLNFTQYENGSPMIYMFSRGENHGFYAVSADDSSAPLLGYSDSGTLPASYDQLPDGMRYWLETLAEQVSYNTTHGLSYMPSPRISRQSIDPLCQTKWNQSTPYNDLCPTVGTNKCMTGCVATAMAQVLKYYNYPESIQGSHSYEWRNQTLSIDSSVTFDWNNMCNTYTGSETETQNTAVATLMRACGISVDMNYGTGSSGAVTMFSKDAFINNFGFDQGARWLEHSYYTSSEWEDLIYNNLRDFGPVLFSGRNTSSGHAFVCDGYNNGLYHFNWGWGGMSDGYFVLTALNPGAQGIGGSTDGYNLEQGILCNLKVEHTSETPYQYLAAANNINFKVEVKQTGETTILDCIFSAFNESPCDVSGVLGISIIPEDGTDPLFADGSAFSLNPGHGYYSRTLSITLPADLPDGTYTIVPAWKNESGEIAKIMYPANSTRSYVLTKGSEGVTVTANMPASISASDFTLVSELYKGSSFKNSAVITNTSATQEYSGILSVGLVKDGERVAIGNSALLTLGAGESTDWEYISPLRYYVVNGETQEPAAGDYEMYLYQVNGSSYTPIAGPITVTLHDATPVSLKIDNLSIADNQPFWDMTATATVKCTSGYFAGTLQLYIFPGGGGRSLGSFNSEYFCIQAPGASSTQEKAAAVGEVEISWHLPFANGEANTDYFALAYLNSSKISNYAHFTTSQSIDTGIDDVAETGSEIVDTEYYTMTGIAIGSERLQSGIYIVREKHADGSVTTRRVAF